jgi:two-component system sensor histidine kinase/response regulator
VLVIDDNESARVSLCETLQMLGLRAQAVSSGRQGLACLSRAEDELDPYAIIFIDWQMPDLDGFETANQIQSLGLQSMPKLFLVTAYGREVVHQHSLSAVFDGLIHKPVQASGWQGSLRLLTTHQKR